eukprot:jgi/Mesen1/3792/ME000206S02972
MAALAGQSLLTCQYFPSQLVSSQRRPRAAVQSFSSPIQGLRNFSNPSVRQCTRKHVLTIAAEQKHVQVAAGSKKSNSITTISSAREEEAKCSPLHQAGKAALAVLLAVLQTVAPLPLDYLPQGAGGWGSQIANATLYSPDTKVPRTAEVALRKAIPAVNPTMKIIQMATADKAAILAAVPAGQKEKGAELYELMFAPGKPGGLEGLLASIQLQDADKVSIRLASVLDNIAELEILQAPGISFLIPPQYATYPRKSDGADDPGEGRRHVVLDGYSAPITAGNFANLILKGAYDGVALKTGNQAVLTGSRDATSLGQELPLEILPAGEFQPVYRTPLDVQDGEIPVLPLSVFGSVAMAHSATSEGFSSPDQFFFYLYDRRSSGLGGLSFEEGQFSVFGYVTKGRELLSQLKTGDVIQSAKLVSGTEHLVNVASPSS